MRKYVIVRMRNDTYERFKAVQEKMNADIRFKTGKPYLELPMIKVFDVVVNPYYNEKLFEIDKVKLVKLSRVNRGKL